MRSIIAQTGLICGLIVGSVFGGTAAKHPQQSSGRPSFRLQLVRTITFYKPGGNIDQIVELPQGIGYIIRDSTIGIPAQPAIELYGPDGHFIRKIGSFGLKPGQYKSPTGVAYVDGFVWVLDAVGRLTRFDLNGRLVDSTLVERPGFRPYGMAFDVEHDRYYLTGCVALHFYLDLGCTMIHEYELSRKHYLTSFANNDQDAVKNKYFGLESYNIALDGNVIYAIDAPVRKLWRISPDSKVESISISSPILQTIPPIDPTLPFNQIASNQWLLANIIVANHAVVLSAGLYGHHKYVLEVLSPQGKLVATDIPAPGQLVGKSERGDLFFSKQSQGTFQVDEDREYLRP